MDNSALLDALHMTFIDSTTEESGDGAAFTSRLWYFVSGGTPECACAERWKQIERTDRFANFSEQSPRKRGGL
jgi:hypothetical protein